MVWNAGMGKLSTHRFEPPHQAVQLFRSSRDQQLLRHASSNPRTPSLFSIIPPKSSLPLSSTFHPQVSIFGEVPMTLLLWQIYNSARRSKKEQNKISEAHKTPKFMWFGLESIFPWAKMNRNKFPS